MGALVGYQIFKGLNFIFQPHSKKDNRKSEQKKVKEKENKQHSAGLQEVTKFIRKL